MATRDDLDELHALAAGISDDVADYRRRRRHRTDILITARTQAEREAPQRRRQRHRVVAGSIVAVVTVTAGVVLGVAGHHHQTRAGVHGPVRGLPANVTPTSASQAADAGAAASRRLVDTGRSADLFSCTAAMTNALRGMSPAQVEALRADYLKACSAGG